MTIREFINKKFRPRFKVALKNENSIDVSFTLFSDAERSELEKLWDAANVNYPFVNAMQELHEYFVKKYEKNAAFIKEVYDAKFRYLYRIVDYALVCEIAQDLAAFMDSPEMRQIAWEPITPASRLAFLCNIELPE